MQKPISFTNDYYHRIQPFLHQLVSKSGSNCFTWMGPVPTILITQPELIREVFNRINEFRKPKMNPLTELLAPGLVSYEGEKWANHKRLVNPAFHVQKLKLMLPAFEKSVTEIINKWEEIVSKTGSSEVDVWPHLTTLTADAISRAAFCSSYEDGRKLFELLTEQKELVIRLFKFVYIPGWKLGVSRKIGYRPVPDPVAVGHGGSEIGTDPAGIGSRSKSEVPVASGSNNG
ncbi:hypothetical protein BVRB_5g102660 [Beta vulgaris subsp. vulgaris]|nr:hypothetical protein BVRB_5g102660 [Beta vulgaris subsp. vulgaris]